tara:strand:- start:151 stop:672 length:522 start_codon:yes stop_codon:yes gene_type:complete
VHNPRREGLDVTPYTQFAQDHKHLSRDDFLAKVGVPHILVTEKQAVRDEEAGFMTVKFTKEVLSESAEAQTFVLPVRKRPDANAFAMMVTLGRAPNNDLVLDHQKVSKFHAYFKQLGEKWVICDANSRNGTVVDGLELQAQIAHPLRSGSKIKLAKVIDLVFLTPEELFQRIN